MREQTEGRLGYTTEIQDRIALLLSQAMALHMQAAGIEITHDNCVTDLETGRTAFALALIELAERFDVDAVRAHAVH